jgi:hypothetical protein
MVPDEENCLLYLQLNHLGWWIGYKNIVWVNNKPDFLMVMATSIQAKK